MPGPPALLRGIDRAAFAVALVDRLRSRGVMAGVTAIGDLVGALAAAPTVTRSRLYWTARICLVRRHGELAAFDAVFDAVFGDAALPMDPHARRQPIGPPPAGDERHASAGEAGSAVEQGAGLPWITLPPVVAAADDSDSPLTVPERLPSAVAGLLDEPFEHLGPQELRLLGQWLEAVVRSWPMRRSRRMAIDKVGHRVALRATMARSRRTGWEPVDLVCTRPRDRPRPVLMLCDVSQSMQAQAGAYLHLMRALALRTDAEVFAFATTLTRLTTVLVHRSAEVAIEQAGARVTDRFGGTRIATNLQALLASHHGNAVRGAIVIVGSDGWDSDPPEQLAVAMARLRRRAYRVIWLNPRAAAAGFQPRVGAMAAAVPYCDELLPADTFGSLAGAVEAITRSQVSSRASRGWTVGTSRR